MRKRQTVTERMNNLFESLADSVLTMSDEEIIEECIERGEDPHEVAKHVLTILEKAVAEWKARARH